MRIGLIDVDGEVYMTIAKRYTMAVKIGNDKVWMGSVMAISEEQAIQIVKDNIKVGIVKENENDK